MTNCKNCHKELEENPSQWSTAMIHIETKQSQCNLWAEPEEVKK